MTWAVIVGIEGDEHNRFYQRGAEGSAEHVGGDLVTTNTGVAFLPDDLHSIHIKGDAPVINFHMYGLGLEQLKAREYYSAKDNTWKTFSDYGVIHEARMGYQ